MNHLAKTRIQIHLLMVICKGAFKMSQGQLSEESRIMRFSRLNRLTLQSLKPYYWFHQSLLQMAVPGYSFLSLSKLGRLLSTYCVTKPPQPPIFNCLEPYECLYLLGACHVASQKIFQCLAYETIALVANNFTNSRFSTIYFSLKILTSYTG